MVAVFRFLTHTDCLLVFVCVFVCLLNASARLSARSLCDAAPDITMCNMRKDNTTVFDDDQCTATQTRRAFFLLLFASMVGDYSIRLTTKKMPSKLRRQGRVNNVLVSPTVQHGGLEWPGGYRRRIGGCG